jgi:plasmid maintenance system antidote protein VapI
MSWRHAAFPPTPLAIALRLLASRINQIVRGRRAVTPETALRFARYFGGKRLPSADGYRIAISCQ